MVLGELPRKGSARDAVLVDYLAQHRVFGVLPTTALRALASHVAERTYARGHYLSYAGDPLTYLIVVKAGLVVMTKGDEHGNVHAALTLFPGDLAGLAVAVSDRQWRLSALAVMDTTALLVGREAFEELYRGYPALAQQVASELAEMSRRSQQAMIRLTQATVAARLAAFLVHSASRTATASGEMVALDLPASQQGLALLLGTTRETVNRVLVRFAHDGLIVLEGRRVRVLRLDALRDLADR